MLLAHSDVVLRTAPFSLEHRWLFWARVHLYANRLELTGWSIRGRYHRSIPLVRIEEAESSDGLLALHRSDGTTLHLQLDAPEQWASRIAIHRDVHTTSV